MGQSKLTLDGYTFRFTPKLQPTGQIKTPRRQRRAPLWFDETGKFIVVSDLSDGGVVRLAQKVVSNSQYYRHRAWAKSGGESATFNNYMSDPLVKIMPVIATIASELKARGVGQKVVKLLELPNF